jgi:hypothetical protein
MIMLLLRVPLVPQIVACSNQIQKATPKHIRSVVCGLARSTGIDWEAIASKGNEATALVLAAASRPWTDSPSIFAAYLLLTERLTVCPDEFFDPEDLNMLHAYACIAIAILHKDHTFVNCGASILYNISRVLIEKNFAERGESISLSAVKSLLTCSNMNPAEVIENIVPALEVLYDAKVAVADTDPPVRDQDRLAIGTAMLQFLKEQLEPSIKARETLWLASGVTQRRSEMKRARIALVHRRMTWETSIAISTGKWPPLRTKQWLKVAAAYDILGDKVNSALALSNTIDAILDALNRRPDQVMNFSAALRVLTINIETRLSDLFEFSELKRSLLRRLSQALLILHEPETAKRHIEAGLALLTEDLKATSDNENHRSYLLRDADDWLGIQTLIEWPPASWFSETYKTLRGADFPIIQANNAASIARIFVTRSGSFIAAILEGETDIHWIRASAGSDLAQTLDEFRRTALKDVNAMSRGSLMPSSAELWKALVRRLCAQLGLFQLNSYMVSSVSRRWIIQCEGVDFHLPMVGLFFNILRSCTFVATSFRDSSAIQPPLPEAKDSVLAINAFPVKDQLHGYFKQLSSAASCYHKIASADEFRKALQTPARLVIFGCHGSDSGAGGETFLHFQKEIIPLREVFQDLALPRSSTVLCISCFSGAGFVRATGEWESLAQLFLDAGSMAVIANRWYAWFENATWSALLGLVKTLSRVAPAPDLWPAAEALSVFMNEVHLQNDDPRQWVGWGIFVSHRHGIITI